MRCFPRTTRNIEMYCEWPSITRLRVIISKVVNHLLDAYRVLGRQRPFIDEPPHIRIRGRIHVDRERRKRITFCIEKRVLGDVIVSRGIELASRLTDVAKCFLATKWLCKRLVQCVTQGRTLGSDSTHRLSRSASSKGEFRRRGCCRRRSDFQRYLKLAFDLGRLRLNSRKPDCVRLGYPDAFVS